MSFPITHVLMKLGELFRLCRYSMLRHNILTLKLKPLIIQMSGRSSSTVILCMITQAVITSHSFCMLQVLAGYRTMSHRDCKTPKAHSTFFLALSCSWANLFLFSPTRVGYCLYNSGPLRIDTVTQIIPFVVVVAVDSKVHRWAVAFGKPSKHRRALKHD